MERRFSLRFRRQADGEDAATAIAEKDFRPQNWRQERQNLTPRGFAGHLLALPAPGSMRHFDSPHTEARVQFIRPSGIVIDRAGTEMAWVETAQKAA